MDVMLLFERFNTVTLHSWLAPVISVIWLNAADNYKQQHKYTALVY